MLFYYSLINILKAKMTEKMFSSLGVKAQCWTKNLANVM